MYLTPLEECLEHGGHWVNARCDLIFYNLLVEIAVMLHVRKDVGMRTATGFELVCLGFLFSTVLKAAPK